MCQVVPTVLLIFRSAQQKQSEATEGAKETAGGVKEKASGLAETAKGFVDKVMHPGRDEGGEGAK